MCFQRRLCQQLSPNCYHKVEEIFADISPTNASLNDTILSCVLHYLNLHCWKAWKAQDSNGTHFLRHWIMHLSSKLEHFLWICAKEQKNFAPPFWLRQRKSFYLHLLITNPRNGFLSHKVFTQVREREREREREANFLFGNKLFNHKILMEWKMYFLAQVLSKCFLICVLVGAYIEVESVAAA